MRLPQKLLAIATLLLLAVASYMRLTETVVKSRYTTGKYRTNWHTGYDSGNSVFLCALLTGAVWCVVVWIGRGQNGGER